MTHFETLVAQASDTKVYRKRLFLPEELEELALSDSDTDRDFGQGARLAMATLNRMAAESYTPPQTVTVEESIQRMSPSDFQWAMDNGFIEAVDVDDDHDAS